MSRGTWSVVCTVRAPDALVERFVAHHLALGADCVQLFFDDPDCVWPTPAIADGRVLAHVCSTEWWAPSGGRPGPFEHRQLHNVEFARQRTSSEWLLHIDADEFLVREQTVATSLGTLASDVFSVLVSPVEAVYEREPADLAAALATPWFRPRSPCLTQEMAATLYGGSADLPREGLFGHLGGKTFVRVAMEVGKAAIHRPSPEASRLRANVSVPGLGMLHFHALDFEDWLQKWARRASGEVRIHGQQAARLCAAFQAAMAHGGRESARQLYREWYVPGAQKLHRAAPAGIFIHREPVGHSSLS
jgi:hypothetical protein